MDDNHNAAYEIKTEAEYAEAVLEMIGLCGTRDPLKRARLAELEDLVRQCYTLQPQALDVDDEGVS